MNGSQKYRLLFALLLGVMMGWLTPPASAQPFPQPPPQQITFKQQLEFGLRARTPAEFAYLGSIANLVESGGVPRRIVNIAFLWSRKKKVYPIPYFARALFLLAQREGITVPEGPYPVAQ